MGWVDDLKGATVGLDTAPLIYYLEERPGYVEKLDPFFEAVEAGELQVVTSTITLCEVLAQPLKRGDEALAARYNDLLSSSSAIEVVPVTRRIAQLGAELRAASRLKTPDAIQAATAIDSGAAALLTNDRDFRGVAGLKTIRLDELTD